MNPAAGTGTYTDAQETGTRALCSALLYWAMSINLSSGQASTVGRRQQAS